MTIRAILIGATVLGAITVLADASMARPVPIGNHNPDGDKHDCLAGDGTFFSNGTAWGCVTKGGGSVVCGGTTPSQKNTCEIGRVAAGGRMGQFFGRLGIEVRLNLSIVLGALGGHELYEKAGKLR